MMGVLYLALLMISLLPGAVVSGETTAEARLGEEDVVHPPVPGHMQPLGSHRPMEGEIERIDYVPDPVTFYEEFVRKERPVVFDRVVLETPPLTKWTDQYLEDMFGDERVFVEHVKKENRKHDVSNMSLRQFLERYKEEDIYMVNDISMKMREEIFLPGCIGCGGYLNNVDAMVMWFSSGGTKSVLHTDSYHNMHCLASGEKRFIMIPPKYTKVIGPEWEGQGYYNLDVDAVNMTAYPNMVAVPWYEAVLNPGDCLFLPYNWIHHVTSYGRNIGVNLWFLSFVMNTTDCLHHKTPQTVPLSGLNTHEELVLNVTFNTEVRKDGLVHVDDVHERLTRELKDGSYTYITKPVLRELFEIVSPGCEGRAEKSMFKDVDNGAKEDIQELLATAKEDIQELLTTAKEDMVQLAIEENHPDGLVETNKKKVVEHEEL